MNRNTRLVIAGVISLAAFWAVQAMPSNSIPRNADTMVRAAEIMEQALQSIRKAREVAGVVPDRSIDPGGTGLIGPEASPIVTTPGDPAAKRSAANPNVAGYIAYLLDRAGVKPGETIAVGSSGSFPAFLVATLSAAKAMNVRAVTILSLGASSYGATDPEFTLLDLYELLRSEGVTSLPPAAVSLGGERDTGAEFDAQTRSRLIGKIRASGIPVIDEPDLAKNVALRMGIYEQTARTGIAAFVNSGGNYANMGTSPQVLDVRPGLNVNLPLPPLPGRGVIFGMAARGIPVIHLLFVKGLVMEAGLPWDPIPLPRPAVVRPPGSGAGRTFWLICIGYFTALCALAAWPMR